MGISLWIFLGVNVVFALATTGFVLWLVLFFLPAWYQGPPFVGASPERAAAVLTLAEVRPGTMFVDLGAGDGRLLLAAAARGALAIGYEINPFYVVWARWRVWRAGQHSRVTVHWRNFWNADCRRADVVVVYGFSTIMDRLEQKLQREIRPDARVVLVHYSFPTWPMDAALGDVRRYRHVLPTGTTRAMMNSNP